MMRRVFALGCVGVLAAACGGDSSVTVTLATSTSPIFDPYQGAVVLKKVRVTVDGAGQSDDASVDLDAATKTAKIAYAGGGPITVSARGFDELGNVVAYGASGEVALDGDATVSIQFHRNLAFTTHYPNEGQQSPESSIYAIDVASRTYLATLRPPGTRPNVNWVSARGGESLLATYSDGGKGFLGVLSTATGEWSTIELMQQVGELALASPGKKIAVVAGGGYLSYVDLEAKTVLKEFESGGSVRDGAISADGGIAIFATSGTPGVLITSLKEGCTTTFMQRSCLDPQDPVLDPSGVALASDGITAFITSQGERSVQPFDLSTGQAISFDGASFSLPVGPAAFAADVRSVLAVGVGDGCAKVLGFIIPGKLAIPASAAPPTLPCPADIAADPSGRRVLVITQTESSTSSSGLTMVEATADPGGRIATIGSTGSYPLDPNDKFPISEFVEGHQRYRPRHIGILYGR